jgi:hypothetical protein
MLASVNKARPMVVDRQAAGEQDKIFRAFVDKAVGAKLQTVKAAKTA